MKTLLVILLLLVGFNSYSETEWIIAHNYHNETTIFSLNEDLDTSITTYYVNNPTTEYLKNIGLPKHLWEQVSNVSGVYDTRIAKLEEQNKELTQFNTSLKEELKEAELSRDRALLIMVILITLLLFVEVFYFFSYIFNNE